MPKQAGTVFSSIFGECKKTTKIKSASLPTVAIPTPLVTRDQLVALLNEDLILEYTAALQYFQHYARTQGRKYDSFRSELKKHGMEEIGHAATLADRISYMGGVPAVGTNNIKLSGSPRQMLEMNLVDEKIAVSRYKERIAQALTLGEYGLADILQDILVDEEEHQDDLETVLVDEGVVESAPYVKM